jgi:hypothetical protein
MPVVLPKAASKGHDATRPPPSAGLTSASIAVAAKLTVWFSCGERLPIGSRTGGWLTSFTDTTKLKSLVSGGSALSVTRTVKSDEPAP